MSTRAMPAPSAKNDLVAAIEVAVRGRWDALALFEALEPFDPYLVQHARPLGRPCQLSRAPR